MGSLSLSYGTMQSQYLLPEPASIAQGYFVANSQQPIHRSLATRIQAGFAKHYGADVQEFMPLLACLGYSEQRYCCFGLRSASQPLFINQYLEQPLAEHLQQWQCLPSQCIELGNLVSTHSQATLAHFVVLAKALQQADKRKLVFCATAHIRNLLTRIGAPFAVLGDAKPERLADCGLSWGSYYKNTPQVCVVDVKQVCHHVDSTDTLAFFAKSYQSDIANLALEVAQL